MDVITPQPQAEVREPETQPEGSVNAGAQETPLPPDTFYKLKEHFGLHYSDSGADDKLSFLVQRFKSAGARSFGDIMLSLKNVELQLGTTNLQSVYNYLRLDDDIEELLKLKASMTNAR